MRGSPKTNLSFLENVPLFAGLTDCDLLSIVMECQPRSYARDAIVLRQGEPTDALHVLLTGRAKALVVHPDGREITLAVIRAGEFFGEMGLVDGAPRAATVQALEPCTTLRLPRRTFDRLLRSNFGLVMNVARGLVSRLRAADRSIESLALMDVYGRVARLLLDQAESAPHSSMEMVVLSQQEISRMVGASREMVRRILRDLQQRGQIRIARGRIFIEDCMIRQLRPQARH
jgi:CRP/FNR family cyclic AMP-dependent transcriptional regulator